MNFLIVILGKLISFISKRVNLGSGSTWPGHIALKLNSNFISGILKNSNTKIIVVAGTNGKTTTARLITSIIRENHKSYLQNKAGANLINGLASTLISGLKINGKLEKDYLIFESDENALPKIIEQINPNYVICLDLFRDQLDRYGEIDLIAKKWAEAFKKLSNETTLILNADDPKIAFLSKNTKAKVLYFGLNEKGKDSTSHGADSTYCPNCSYKLNFDKVFFSHLGVWKCPNCKLERPKLDLYSLSQYSLLGTYNKYNSLAAALFAKSEGFKEDSIVKSFKNFTPAFGRQERLTFKGKNVQIFLSKNPTSFNESLQTIKEIRGSSLLFILNDKIPDGLDVSWIWDINFEDILTKDFNIAVSGERAYDMAIRLKYASAFTHVEPDIDNALNKMIDQLDKNETLYILPNYSAMLEVRKIITGRKML